MSRCFPFRPPGYEKKARIEDLDLPKKDKHKNRKKEKRDQKEKRKSRNRDKRDKEKDRVKDKARTLDEAKLPDKTYGHGRQFFVQKDQKDKGNCSSTEKKYAGLSTGYTVGESNHSSHLPEKSRAFKIVPELGRRSKDGDGGSRNLLEEKFSVCLPQRDDWVGSRILARVTQSFDEGKTKDENKENDENGDREIRKESKFSSRATIEAMVKDRVGSVDKNADTRTEGKRLKGNGRDEKRNQKQKDKDKQEGKGKDKDRDKNKKRKEKIEQKIGNLEKSKESNEDDVTSTDSIITSLLLKDSHKPLARIGSVMKRKDFETNGILHGKDHMSGNSAKFTSSSDLPRDFKMLKPRQSSLVAASNWQVHSKPPHPDLEYPSQVYLVPKMDEWSDFCDQDWLFSSNASKLKKLKAHGLEMEMTTPHVWAEAMHIESINICALPYVVPY